MGIVNAVEIVQTFRMRLGDGSSLIGLEEKGAEGALTTLIGGLRQFKQWLDGYDFGETVRGLAGKRVRKKLAVVMEECDEEEGQSEEDKSEEGEGKEGEEQEEDEDEDMNTKLVHFGKSHRGARARWAVKPNFPDTKVAAAFLKPAANLDSTSFQWTAPKLNRIRTYCQSVLGWTEAEMDLKVDPVITRYASRGKDSSQSRIDSYFMTYHQDNRFAKFQSARLCSAVGQLTGKKTSLGVTVKPVKAGKATGRKSK